MLSPVKIRQVLSQAKKAILNSRCFFGLESKNITEEFIYLKVEDSKEIWPLILELLDEIEPENYVPSRSEKSYFCFVWKSDKMKKEMQMQFILKERTFCYLSLGTMSK